MVNMKKSFGRDAFYINKDLVATEQTIVSDTLRNALGKFFIVNDKKSLRYDEVVNPPDDFVAFVSVSSLKPDKEALRVEFTSQADDYEDEFISLSSITNTSEVFYDYYFKSDLPIRHRLLERANKTGTTEYTDADSHYNYYIKPYEVLFLNNPAVSENILPNFYSLYAQGVYEQTNVENLNWLNGNFKTKIGEEFLTVFNWQDENVSSRYAEYFVKFAQVVKNLLSNIEKTRDDEIGSTLFSSLANKYNTYIFSDSSLPLLTTEAVKGEMFPMHNEIRFSTDRNTAFANILRELKIETELIKEVMSNPNPLVQGFGAAIEQYVPSNIPNVPPNQVNTFNTRDLKTWDIKEWISQRIFKNELKGVGIGSVQEETNPANKSLQEVLTKLLLSAKINGFSQNNFRNLEGLFGGTPCYSEVVFYKITKTAAAAPNTPMTVYYIPNSSKLDICRFIDTQVRYGKKYRYRIDAYTLVVGSKYTYNTINKVNGNTIEFGVATAPSMKLVEVPFHNTGDLMVLDAPPMPPESTIVPLRGINNKVIINLNGTTGDRVLDPVKIETLDQQKIDLQKTCQRRSDNKLRFRSDDAPAAFEVFRITKRPSSYMDFQGHRITNVTTKNVATSGALKDTIKPNVKYYYTFRALDVHNNISNPSPVFEIEMIGDQRGLPFLEIKVVDMDAEYISKKEKKELSKQMRRYLQILPTVPQGLLNVPLSNLLVDETGAEIQTVKGVKSVVLGVADESLWGKKFRIRLISKKTGRKIDLDVNFSVEHQLKES
jgi:hypothetical protein